MWVRADLMVLKMEESSFSRKFSNEAEKGKLSATTDSQASKSSGESELITKVFF